MTSFAAQTPRFMLTCCVCANHSLKKPRRVVSPVIFGVLSFVLTRHKTVVQAFKMGLAGHCACDFRHIPVLLRTWIFWILLDSGWHQSWSKQDLLVAASCTFTVSWSPLETIQPFQTLTSPGLTCILAFCQSNCNWQTTYVILQVLPT